ncbi:unnamed protein product [Calicophoron daubneyi]|uniref:Uncharacterized protein n=1 Tax=Calicophoron daubneyi TaxID=300641 RepID=A0AAV2T483_CALDB
MGFFGPPSPSPELLTTINSTAFQESCSCEKSTYPYESASFQDINGLILVTPEFSNYALTFPPEFSVPASFHVSTCYAVYRKCSHVCQRICPPPFELQMIPQLEPRCVFNSSVLFRSDNSLTFLLSLFHKLRLRVCISANRIFGLLLLPQFSCLLYYHFHMYLGLLFQ